MFLFTGECLKQGLEDLWEIRDGENLVFINNIAVWTDGKNPTLRCCFTGLEGKDGKIPGLGKGFGFPGGR